VSIKLRRLGVGLDLFGWEDKNE